MSLNKVLFVLLCISFLAPHAGCNKQTATENLQIRFDAMKASTEAFRDTLAKVIDLETAEEHLDQLNV